MKTHIANLVNAIILITLGSWAYFKSATPSITSLIPVLIGIALLLLYKGVKNENKTLAHMAVILTLLVLIGLFKPLTGAIERGNNSAIARVITMMLSSLYAMILFIKSFINARRSN